MQVAELLKEWGFETLIEIFQDNEIDHEALLLLTPELVRNLIPKVGRQAKFMQKLTEYKLIINSDIIISDCNELINKDQILSPSSSTTTESDISLPIEEFTPPSVPLSFTKSFYGEEELEKLLNPTKHFNLKLLLEQSCEGKIILKQYSDKNSLDNKTRRNLVDLIISHFFKNYGSYMTNQQMEDLSVKINELFPNEKPEIFYIKAIKKSCSKFGKSQVARGKLVDRYRNCRTKLRTAGLLPSASTTSNKDSDIDDSAVELETDQLKKCKQWLQTRTEPWDQVINNWKITFELRHKSQVHNITDFLNEWPPLKLSSGFHLIDIDFDLLYPEKGVLLAEKWYWMFNLIHDFKKDTLKDAGLELSHLLRDEQLNENCKVAIQMLILPYLIPSKGRSRKGKDHWKASILETQHSLIIHAKIPGDIENIISEKINKSKASKQTVQPYIIALGPSLREIEKTYVVLDSVRYSFENTLRALENCFKAFHACNLYYPFESEHIYMLIQLCIFNIKTKWDKSIPYIMEIISLLEQH